MRNGPKLFPIRLLQMQSEHKLNTSQLSAQAKITRTCLNSYARGDTLPDFRTLVKLAERFDVSLDWLCGLIDERKSLK